MTLRAFGVEAKNELENTVSTIELSEMIAESLSEGLLDPEEHNRLSRALQIRTRIVADVAVPLDEIHAVPAAGDGAGPTVAAIQQALAETGYSRFPVVDVVGRFTGYVHIKDVLPLVDDPEAVVDPSLVRPLPRVLESLPLPDALSRLRRDNSHLALVTAADDRVTAMVALEDLVRGPGGYRARRDPPCLSASSTWWFSTRRSGPSGNGCTPSGWTDSSRHTSSGRGAARLTRCGTSCSATTACGRANCAAGTPGTASHAGGESARRFLGRAGYGEHGSAVTVTHEHLVSRIETVEFIADLLQSTAGRPARFNCFGLHEWAMVYRSARRAPRSGSVAARAGGHRRRGRIDAVALQPLRRLPVLHRAGGAPQRGTAEPRVAGRQRTAGVRARRDGHLQVGVQAGPAGRLRTASPTASNSPPTARELDMRASPYDLTGYGFAPIAVETPTGRAEYVRGQQDVADRAAPLRTRAVADRVRRCC